MAHLLITSTALHLSWKHPTIVQECVGKMCFSKSAQSPVKNTTQYLRSGRNTSSA